MPSTLTLSQEPETEIEKIVPLIPKDARLITIDGHSCVGKSRIARPLAKALGRKLFEVDRYLRSDVLEGYTDRVDTIRFHVELAIALERGPVMVEGLCIEQLVPPAAFGPRFRIYVEADPLPDDEEDAADRAAEFRTDAYHRSHDPIGRADVLLIVPHTDLSEARRRILEADD